MPVASLAMVSKLGPGGGRHLARGVLDGSGGRRSTVSRRSALPQAGPPVAGSV